MGIAAKIVATLAALLAPLPALATRPGDTILIAGDSTASTYKGDRYPQTGWGQMLSCGLSPDMRVRNHAMGGRSTRTFLAEGRWEALLAEALPPEAAAGLDLSDRLNSTYNVYIYNAPEWPADFDRRIPRNNRYRSGWAGNGPWSISNGGYTIPTTAGLTAGLVYSQVPTKRQAVQLKWQLERIAAGVGNKKIGVRIDSVK